MLDDLAIVAPRANNTELRTILGSFLFSEDDVFKQIGVLSGGERNRYALARMLMNPSNFLLLDEPTNHLDMRAKDVLLRALQNFTGTVVFVSHDRYFLEQLATRVVEVAAGQVHSFPGTFAEFMLSKNGRPAADVPAMVEPAKLESMEGGPAPLSKASRLNPIKVRQLKTRQSEIEGEISRIEEEIAQQERELVNFQSAERSMKIHDHLNSLRGDLEKLMVEWEEVAHAVEANA